MYHPSSSGFMTNMTLSGAEKHQESTEPESSKMAKMFLYSLLLLLLSSDVLAQYCVNLSHGFIFRSSTTPTLVTF